MINKGRKKNKFLFLSLIILLVNGCISAKSSNFPQGFSLSQHFPGQILNVPFIKQKKAYCGPAALCSVLNYWKFFCTQETIAQKIYQPDLRGVLNVSLQRYAQEQGFWAKSYQGSFKRLKEFLKNGHPVIVIEKLHPYILNRRHYVVIVGFREDEKLILEHTGKQAFVRRSYHGFLRNWQCAGKWMLVVCPPEKVNFTLTTLEEYLELGVMLEKKEFFDLALNNYHNALNLQKDNPVILFNIGNIYLKTKLWDKAEQSYLRAIDLKEDFADCSNNLSYVYLNKANYDLAYLYIEKALADSIGQKRFFYLDTKAQIFFKQGKYKDAIKFFKMAEHSAKSVSRENMNKFYQIWEENFKKINRIDSLSQQFLIK